jgi:hypothetical protein
MSGHADHSHRHQTSDNDWYAFEFFTVQPISHPPSQERLPVLYFVYVVGGYLRLDGISPSVANLSCRQAGLPYCEDEHLLTYAIAFPLACSGRLNKMIIIIYNNNHFFTIDAVNNLF